MMSNLPRSIKQTQERLKKGEISAVGLVDDYLARIKEADAKINAFITITDETAYQKAKAVDEIIKDNENAFREFPLLGAVVASKDLFATKNVRTTAGSKVLESFLPAYSATAVERLEKAGAVMIGKTNCDAWAHGASGENSDFGATHNPWNLECVPGGSSSGSAAAVGAGFCLAALGTDTGGSIRQPASFCNAVGLKPTYGAVSRYGLIAMASSLDTVGQITHTVDDARRIFAVVKGEDGYDSTVANTKPEESNQLRSRNSKLKIGIPKEYFVAGLDKEVEKIVLEAITVFKKEGIEIVEISLPHTKYAISTYYIIQPAEVSSNLGRYDGVRYGNTRQSFGDEAKRRIMLGTYVLSAGYYDAYYLKAMKVRSKLIADFENVFSSANKIDAILAPVSPTPPFKIGEKVDDPLQMYLADIFTVSANLAGIPALSLPGGFTKAGLPVGFQLMGPRFSENVLFSLGELFQEKTDYHLKEPPFK